MLLTPAHPASQKGYPPCSLIQNMGLKEVDYKATKRKIWRYQQLGNLTRPKYNGKSNLMFPFFFFLLLKDASEAYGGSQATGPTGATAASLRHSHSNITSERP